METAVNHLDFAENTQDFADFNVANAETNTITAATQ